MKLLLPSTSPLIKSEPPMMGPPGPTNSSTSSDGKQLSLHRLHETHEKLVLLEAQRVEELEAHIRQTGRKMTEDL